MRTPRSLIRRRGNDAAPVPTRSRWAVLVAAAALALCAGVAAAAPATDDVWVG